MRGADLLVRTLALAGVRHIYALSGNQIMPVFDACLEAGVTLTHTRHEAGAVYMAEAHAQLTRGIGVALVTAGAGIGNATGAILSARASETPVLILSGDSPVGQDGKGAFQEFDQAAMTAPLTKLSRRIRTVEEMGSAVAEAIALALSGRPGPVHLALPFDLVNAGTGMDPVRVVLPEPVTPELPQIAEAVRAAARPLVILGPALNATRAPGLAGRLADALGAPVLAMESPRGLRDPSLGALGTVFAEADLILSLGKQADFTTGFGAGGDWIVVDPDAPARDMARRNLGERLRRVVAADAAAMAQALASGQGADPRPDWRARVEGLTARRPDLPAPGARLSSASLCAALQARIATLPDPVVISDGGEFGQWAQALTRGAARVVNGVSGAIGGGLPYAMAAARACSGRPVIAFVGDGTVGFLLSEFETAAREGLPFVLIVGNDRRWNAEHQIQLRDYGNARLIGCELSDARYDLAAAALGAHGEHVTRPEDLGPALDRALASGKPACLNVEMDGLPAPTVTGP
ncbi:thiamine pyrophosphate-binding protein [Halovulum dunhuangense]|uniref:Thiamine pyrophosphate-binding protein n=1 Tax=Halovulum dunhuangense TaxID=1505036 RepID=A0A849L426_9RHOB|nr:thiamine pyrophosphate-binding protein [Halovulum dunhuangense]NNU80970.1 thiamine pyrophosphate-binding protein [Halovulum dunhuangense]